MKIIKNLINKFKTNLKPPQLGRWNIENCNKKIDSKVDLSNEDHCGPCGQYVLNKNVKNKNYESKRSVDFEKTRNNNKNKNYESKRG
jgi:hypothetical protein